MAKSPTRSRGKAAAKAAPGKVKARPLTDGNGEILRRIAEALERLAPPAPPTLDFDSADAFVWYAEDHRLAPVRRVNRVEMSLLKGIDRVRDLLVENTQRFARGLPANNALLWGARGMGKSSLVKAAHAGTDGVFAQRAAALHRVLR